MKDMFILFEVWQTYCTFELITQKKQRL